jgi:hypothetical protein
MVYRDNRYHGVDMNTIINVFNILDGLETIDSSLSLHRSFLGKEFENNRLSLFFNPALEGLKQGKLQFDVDKVITEEDIVSDEDPLRKYIGYTPLEMAIEFDNWNAASALREAKAENMGHFKLENLICGSPKRLLIARYLARDWNVPIDECPEAIAQANGRMQSTPLKLALQMGHRSGNEKAVESVLEGGAKVTTEDLLLAAYLGEPRFMEMLFKVPGASEEASKTIEVMDEKPVNIFTAMALGPDYIGIDGFPVRFNIPSYNAESTERFSQVLGVIQRQTGLVPTVDDIKFCIANEMHDLAKEMYHLAMQNIKAMSQQE